MHPRLAELLEYVQVQTEELRRTYEAVPPERRTVRPEPGRWSPAEIVNHLVIVDRRINQRFKALIEEARALAPETEASAILPQTIASRVINRDRRISTGQASEPRDTDAARVLDDLALARRELEEIVATGDGLALGKVSAPHPAFGPISGHDWLAFVGAHAARHAEQIRESV